MRTYLSLFLLFLQAGLLGYADPWGSLFGLEQGAASAGWVSAQGFTDFSALNTALPGLFTANFATFAGWHALGLAGVLTALVALSLPAFAFTAGVVFLERHPRCRGMLTDTFPMLRLAAFGLFLAALYALLVALPATEYPHSAWQIGVSAFLGVATLVGVALFRLRPWVMVLCSGVAGIILF